MKNRDIRNNERRYDFNHRVDITITDRGADVKHESDSFYYLEGESLPTYCEAAPANIYFHASTDPNVKLWLFDIFDETPSITLGELRDVLRAHLARRAEVVRGDVD